MRISIAPLFALVMAACNPAVSPPADHHIGDAIRAQEVAMNATLASRNADQAAAYYAPDAHMYDPGSPAATTPEGVHNEFTTLFNDPNGSLSFHTDDVVIPSSGEYAVSSGTFTVSYSDPASHQKVSQSGNYVTVWRHQDDGSWKIIRDISTPGPAGPSAAPNK